MDIQDYRIKVEDNYLGFRPNTYSVKPVHIANGLFKGLTGKRANTEQLYNFIYTGNAKGIIEKEHHETDKVYQDMSKKNIIDTMGVHLEPFPLFRSINRKVVTADGAVFGEGMVSFTAANVNMIGKDTIAQEGGELFAYAIKKMCPDLAEVIRDLINSDNDIISTLFSPTFSYEMINHNMKIYLDENSRHYLNQESLKPPFDVFNKNMSAAMSTLKGHITKEVNKLVGLRMVVLFGCYWLIRQLYSAESMYCKTSDSQVMPMLIDLSEESTEPIAKASMMNYTLACQSLARFYAEKLGEVLKEKYSIETLLDEPTPKYKNKEANKDVWEMVKEDVEANRNTLEENALYTKFGAAIYDMLALEASSNPVKYMRSLGMKSGIFYPPTNNPPTKRFLPSQDVFETIIRSLIEPKKIVNITDIKNLLWERLGIIIGGRLEDITILKDAGIYQVDDDALKENSERFIRWLKELDFANLMADGVIQIRTGV